MAKRFFYVCAGLLCLAVCQAIAPAALAQFPQSTPVGSGVMGWGGHARWLIFFRDGTVYQGLETGGTGPRDTTWAAIGNVLTKVGLSPQTTWVADVTYRGGYVAIITGEGDRWWSPNGSDWEFSDNVFDLAGIARELVAAYSENTATVATLSGKVIQNGTLVHDAGGEPTSTEAHSFGSLKVRYRGEREPQGVKPSTNR